MEERIIFELPPLAASIVIVCLAVALAGLGIYLAAPKVVEIIRLVRRTLAASARIQHRSRCQDRAALNYWIRDSFAQKRLTERAQADATKASARADQEHSLRIQLAETADAMMQRKGATA